MGPIRRGVGVGVARVRCRFWRQWLLAASAGLSTPWLELRDSRHKEGVMTEANGWEAWIDLMPGRSRAPCERRLRGSNQGLVGRTR